jgi:hypothetical protein
LVGVDHSRQVCVHEFCQQAQRGGEADKHTHTETHTEAVMKKRIKMRQLRENRFDADKTRQH